MLDQLILIIFGWALGFPSTIGSDRYRKWRQNVSFRMSIKFELDDLRYLAITSAYLVRQRMCTMTPEFARKFSRISESYEKWGLDDPRRIATDALLRLDEKQMADFSYQLNQNRKQGLALKPLQIPYLYARAVPELIESRGFP